MNEKPQSCTGCPFRTTGIGFVPLEGAADARVRICGEAPGEEEANTGRPFVGRSGQIMRRALRSARLGERCAECVGKGCPACSGIGQLFPTLAIFNTIQCRPPGNDYSAVPQEAVAYCKRAHHPPIAPGSLTFLVGARALDVYFPHNLSIERWSGSILPLDDAAPGARAVPVLHPAYIMRGQWPKLPLIAATLAGALSTEPWEPPRIVRSITPTRTLALDVETDGAGDIDLVGLSFDGREVRQLAPNQRDELEMHLDVAEEILIHNAEFDLGKLKAAGVRIDPSRVIDTMIEQAAYQSDLEVGLDDALAITLAGRWTYHKSLDGEGKGRAHDRAFTRAVWRRLLDLPLEPSAVEWRCLYNMLDVAGTWRLGRTLQERMS